MAVKSKTKADKAKGKGKGKPPARSSKPAAKLQTLKVSAIRTDGGTQPREKMDDAVAEAYRADLEQGATFPPVEVAVDDDGTAWLWDGFHRVKAHQLCGREEIQVNVRPGSQRDAIRWSLGANSTHGMRRHHDDVRRAAERMLRDKEWGAWSDARIAKEIGCHNMTVRAHRERLEAAGEIAHLEELLSEDNKWQSRSKKRENVPPNQVNKLLTYESPSPTPATEPTPAPAPAPAPAPRPATTIPAVTFDDHGFIVEDEPTTTGEGERPG